MATPAGTERYVERFDRDFEHRYFRDFAGCQISSVGAGTYLGDPTDEVDQQYRQALEVALENGINVIDTAINFRCQRSERLVSSVLTDAPVNRDEVLVATKGGYLQFDNQPPDDPGEYLRSTFVETGLVDPDDVAEGTHCLAPDFLDYQLDKSLENLELDTIDLYYIQNPEVQLTTRSPDAVYDQIEAAFTRLEERVRAGDIRQYGVAAWDAFRVDADDEAYLSLSEILSRARSAANAAGNGETHLSALQLPFSPLMADAFTVRAHDTDIGQGSALRFARDEGLSVFVCASLAQGKVIAEMPEEVAVWFRGDTTAQRALTFARSAPAATCALVGMRQTPHVTENAAAGEFDSMGSEAFGVVFEG